MEKSLLAYRCIHCGRKNISIYLYLVSGDEEQSGCWATINLFALFETESTDQVHTEPTLGLLDLIVYIADRPQEAIALQWP